MYARKREKCNFELAIIFVVFLLLLLLSTKLTEQKVWDRTESKRNTKNKINQNKTIK